MLGFGAVFVLHTFRFQLSGKICSGDFDDDVANYPYSGTYLKDQGRYLIGLVCFVWIVGILLCLLSACIALLTFKPLLHAVVTPVIKFWKAISFVHRLERGN